MSIILYKSENQSKLNNESSYVDPNWLVGFLEGEGCFATAIQFNKHHKNNNKAFFNVWCWFTIAISELDKDVLYKIKAQLGYGKITKVIRNKECVVGKVRSNYDQYAYRISNRKDILKFIKLVDSYSFHTIKYKDYVIWKKIFFLTIIKNNKFNLKDLKEICELRLQKSKTNQKPKDYDSFVEEWYRKVNV